MNKNKHFAAALLLCILPLSGATAQIFKGGFGDFDHSFSVEAAAVGNFIWLKNEAAFPENGSPAPGGELGLSFFYGEYFGASLLNTFTTPIEEGYEPPLQYQLFAGPSFKLTQSNFAMVLTPALYFYLLAPVDYEIVNDIGIGGNLAVQYHFDTWYYLFGKLNVAYGFVGKDVAFAPTVGVGLNLFNTMKGTAATTAKPTATVKPATAGELVTAGEPAAASEPTTAKEYAELAQAAYKAEDWDAAIEAFTKAIELEPGNVSRKKNLAIVYMRRGNDAYKAKDWDAAISDYTEALKNNPDLTSAKKNLELAQAKKAAKT